MFAATTEAAAASLAKDLASTLGGSASVAEWPQNWMVLWRLPATSSAIDRWECDGWSNRVMQLLLDLNCHVSGFSLF
jgi:hypothetical protein